MAEYERVTLTWSGSAVPTRTSVTFADAPSVTGLYQLAPRNAYLVIRADGSAELRVRELRNDG